MHVARRQTRGRGRGSHVWWSPPGGGLWMSVLLRPRSAPSRLGGLALLAGASVRAAVESLGARSIDLYWPNDLFYSGRKLGGILGEVRLPAASHPPRPEASSLVALGIGVNLDLSGHEVPSDLRDRVASLAETGCRELDPAVLAPRILGEIEARYRLLEAGARIPELVEGAMSGLGRPVRVRIPPTAPFDAVAAGIGEEGELLVDCSGGGGRVALRAAEVDYGP